MSIKRYLSLILSFMVLFMCLKSFDMTVFSAEITDVDSAYGSLSLQGLKSVFDSDDDILNMLNGYTALHILSGCVYNGENKTLLEDKPYFSESELMIPVYSVENLFDAKYAYLENILFINGKNASGIKSSVLNNVTYISFEETASFLGKKTVFNNQALNGGMYIAGSDEFSMPSGAELQKLNDYLFYLRPSAEYIAECYESNKNYMVHPRIIADSSDFERIKVEITRNENKKNIFNMLLYRADRIIESNPLTYKLSDGVRLQEVSEQLLLNMFTLGMAYRLTGDKKYSDRAYEDLYNVASFKDWNPSHHIDVGIMSIGYAVGYDWMYDAFSDDQKSLIEKGFKNKALTEILLSYQTTDCAMTNAAIISNNHNPICNGGAFVGAMAFCDIYTDDCMSVASNAIRGLEYNLQHYSPDGAWYEGSLYGYNNLRFLSYMYAAMEKSLSGLFGLDMVEGFSDAANYLDMISSDVGTFNFGDGGVLKLKSSFWFENHNGTPVDTNKFVETRVAQASGEELCNALLYCTDASGSAKETDRFYEDKQILLMRDRYNKNQTFVGIKAGATVYSHSHLDSGSFVYDYGGVRWANDLGADDYNLDGYWDTGEKRWNIFRMRAESHNTIIVDPDENPEYMLGSDAPISSFESNKHGAVAKIDTEALYAGRLRNAKRGFMFTDSRKSLVIRDELVTLDGKTSDIYWLMYTKAAAEIKGNRVILSDRQNSSKKLIVDFLCNAECEIIYEKAKPFPNTPVVEGQNENKGFYRLVLKIVGSGKVNITVKLTPMNICGSVIENYDKNIDEWSLDNVNKINDISLFADFYNNDKSYENSECQIEAVVSGYEDCSDVIFYTSDDGINYHFAEQCQRETAVTKIKLSDHNTYIKAAVIDNSGEIVDYAILNAAGNYLKNKDTIQSINFDEASNIEAIKNLKYFEYSEGSGTISLSDAYDEKYGKSCKITATGSDPTLLNGLYARVSEGKVIFEADFKFKDTNTSKNLLYINYKSSDGTSHWISGTKIVPIGNKYGLYVFGDASDIKTLLDVNKWYRITEVVDIDSNTMEFYVDNRFVGCYELGVDVANVVRCTIESGISGEETTEFYVDNYSASKATEEEHIRLNGYSTEKLDELRFDLQNRGVLGNVKIIVAAYSNDFETLEKVEVDNYQLASEDEIVNFKLNNTFSSYPNIKIMLWNGTVTVPFTQNLIYCSEEI